MAMMLRGAARLVRRLRVFQTAPAGVTSAAPGPSSLNRKP